MDRPRLLVLRLAGALPYAAGEAADGAESLELHGAAALLAREGEEGPRLALPLPPPLWTGHAAGPAERADFLLAPGDYLFMQWRPADEAELRAGLEWFLRETWWEGRPGEGPFHLRRVREDGKLATQVLRALGLR